MLLILFLILTNTFTQSSEDNCVEYNIDYSGNDISGGRHDNVDGWKTCRELCRANNECNGWTYQTSFKYCYLKRNDDGRRTVSGDISGPKTCHTTGLRCKGLADYGCCTSYTPCLEGDGDCGWDSDCAEGLLCGFNNCPWGGKDDCCKKGDYIIKDTGRCSATVGKEDCELIAGRNAGRPFEESAASFPHGCYKYAQDGKFYFNTHVGTECGSGKGNVCYCEIDYVIKETGRCTASVGKEDCKRIAGTNAGSPFEESYKDVPHGCYKAARDGKFYFNTNKGKECGVNGDVCFCEKECPMIDYNIPADDITDAVKSNTWQECAAMCFAHERCVYWSFQPGVTWGDPCIFKDSRIRNGIRTQWVKGVITGVKSCGDIPCSNGFARNSTGQCAKIAQLLKSQVKILREFTPALNDPDSAEYKVLKKQLEGALLQALKQRLTRYDIDLVEVTGFSNGSVVVEYQVVVLRTDAPLIVVGDLQYAGLSLQQEGTLGNLKLDTNFVPSVTKDDSPKIIIGASVGGAVAGLFFVAMVVYCCGKRRRISNGANHKQTDCTGDVAMVENPYS